MQSITHEVVEPPFITTWKVHHLACLKLQNIMAKITEIFAALESARPRCASGLQVLCSLHGCMERSMLLLRHCSESSKLYLAISGERIILRCERIRNSLESCLSLLQTMVEPTLAAQISLIVDHIETVSFTLDPSEHEAGKALLALLRRDIAASSFANPEELMAFKFAAVRLQIISAFALMIEKRSIRKLISKCGDTDPPKKKILKYFLYLTRKYGKSIQGNDTEGVANKTSEEAEGDGDVFDPLEPPVKFRSGHLSQLSSSSSSIPSFSNSLGDLRLQVDDVSFRSSDTNSVGYATDADPEDKYDQTPERFNCYASRDNGSSLSILAKLSVLPWTSTRKAVEDAKAQLKDDQGSHPFISTSYIKPVFKFLKEAHRLNDYGAKRHGAELLILLLKECRSDVPPLPKNTMNELYTFLDSEITEEALQILEVLSCQQHYNSEIVAVGILPFVLKLIKNPSGKHHNVALRVVCNMSAHMDLGHHLIYLGFIQQLVPLLDDLLLSGYCLKILRNLCAIEEAAAHFVENGNCIASIAELLEVGKDEEIEHALDILLSLHYQREELHEILMQDNILSLLVYLSANGSSRGKFMAIELLQLLNNSPDEVRSISGSSQGTNGNPNRSQVHSVSDFSQGTSGNPNHSRISDTSGSTKGNPKASNSSSKLSGFFGRIKSKWRKSRR